jgi:anti-sigma factor RsiW
MTQGCPDIELLFAEVAHGSGPLLEHAHQCERCSAILEEHRQLEKDLFRLADPPPPANFTQQVMARVAAQPAPIHANVALGLAISVTAFGLGIFTLLSTGGGLSTVGTVAGSVLITAKSFWVGSQKAVSLLWATQALPMAVSLFVVLLLCLFALKRLAGDARVLGEARISG